MALQSMERPMATARGFSASVLDRWLPWAVPALLVLAWQSGAQTGAIPPRILPAPLAVLEAAGQLTLSGELANHLAVSTGRALRAFCVGGGIGLVLGLVTGTSRLGERLLDGPVQMLRTIPILALIPLVILWFGIGEEAKLVLMALGVFFPVYLNTFHGIRSVDPALVEMARSYGLGGGRLFRQVIIPGALPSILVGVRYALGIMWLTLIVAETIAADAGVGYLATNAREFMRTDVVLLTVVLYALFGKLADALTRLLERWLLAWHPHHAG